MALIGILLAAFWLAALALCIQLMLHKPHTKSKNRRRQKPRRKSSRYSPSLENELVSLLNGDNRTADRLIISTRRRHPNQSEQWCREKVIYDLERDRR